MEPFDPSRDAERTRACHEIYLAGAPVDHPRGPWLSLRVFAGWLDLGWSEDPAQTWLARDSAGEPAGWCRVAFPQRENRHIAGVDLMTRPTLRRGGVGAALLRHAARQARLRGRALLAGDARQGGPGEAFCQAIGAQPGLTEEVRVLTVADLPAWRLAALRGRAETAAGGYRLQSWTGPTPDAEVAAVAGVYQAENDAPRDAGREGWLWDADRVRLADHRVAVQGLRRYTVVARREEQAGELAAITQVGVDPLDPSWGFQELTAVTRPHRGHRLGLLVKTAMLELLADREPRLERIITGNAGDNERMIAINEVLGFTLTDSSRSWHLPVDAALAVAGGQS